VFRNDPDEVAAAFAEHLSSPRFAGAFADVVFAVHDRAPGRPNLAAFQACFGDRRV
jgi:uncharacterized protein (TIGR02452 family)